MMMMIIIIIVIIIIEDGQVYIGRGKEQSATARRTFNIESQHRANHWIQKDTKKSSASLLGCYYRKLAICNPT